MGDQEQAAQDVVQEQECREGTRLYARYRGERIAVFVPRIQEPDVPAGTEVEVVPRIELAVACDCGGKDCWQAPPMELRAKFIGALVNEYKATNTFRSQSSNVHAAFMEFMRGVLRVFTQGGSTN